MNTGIQTLRGGYQVKLLQLLMIQDCKELSLMFWTSITQCSLCKKTNIKF